jgi:type IV secretory pathway TraG/TraD family ATPase VirD4
MNEDQKNTIYVGPTGSGKTYDYIRPDIINVANHKANMVVTDVNDNLYKSTLNTLQDKAYEIQKINLASDDNNTLNIDPAWVYSGKKRILFIELATHTDRTQNNSTILNDILQYGLDKANTDIPVLFVLDEFEQIDEMDSAFQVLTEGHKHNMSVVMTMQSMDTLKDAYKDILDNEACISIKKIGE